MAEFTVHLFEADRNCYEGPCEILTIPATDGSLQIMAHHTDMIAALVPGTLRYRVPGQPDRLAAVSSGLVKVEKNDVLVLVDALEWPEEIDEVRARRRADEAREAILQKRSIQEYQVAQATLARAIARLRLKSGMQQTGL